MIIHTSTPNKDSECEKCLDNSECVSCMVKHMLVKHRVAWAIFNGWPQDRLHYDSVQCIFKKKTGQKKPDQDLIFKTRSKSKKVLFCVLDHFATPNQILRSQECPLRLQEDFLETDKRLGISKTARALKTDIDLPECI